eukprot:861863-Prymnesium_polylepis.1
MLPCFALAIARGRTVYRTYMKVGEAVASQNVFLFKTYLFNKQATRLRRPGCMRATLEPRTPSDAHTPQAT